MKGVNMHDTRESWLRSATTELHSYFAAFGYELPKNIRFAIAFTSTGKRGRIAGECWHPSASGDNHYEIIIRADIADPEEVLGVLVHELVHVLLPSTVKHGKEFREIAQRIGLTGKMRQARPSEILKKRLYDLAASLGELPHAKLDFSAASDVPKKQTSRMFKAECGASCGYTIRLAAKWARAGLPVCPIDVRHGPLICRLPESEEATASPEGE
jgi:hypothetical protein